MILQLAYATGILSQFTGNPEYISMNTFNEAGELQRFHYFFDQEIMAVSWISTHAGIPNQNYLYYDIPSGHLFKKYYGISSNDYLQWAFVNLSWRKESYIFLRTENILFDTMFTGVNSTLARYKSIEYMWLPLNYQNLLFSTGGTHVYQVITRAFLQK